MEVELLHTVIRNRVQLRANMKWMRRLPRWCAISLDCGLRAMDIAVL